MGRAGMKRSKKRPAPRPLPKIHEIRRSPTLSGNVRTWFLRFPERELAPLPLPAEPVAPTPWYEYRWLGYIACLLGVAATGAATGAVVRRRRRVG